MKKTPITDEQAVMSNREKALQPRKTKFWCGSCDRAIVRPWVKCPVCGHRNEKKRLLK